MPHRGSEFERLDGDISGLFPERAVLVERDYTVERDDEIQAVGLDTSCVEGDVGRKT